MHFHEEYMRKVYRHFSDDELIDIFMRNDKYREVEYNPIEHFRLSRVLYFHPSVLNVRCEDSSDQREVAMIIYKGRQLKIFLIIWRLKILA